MFELTDAKRLAYMRPHEAQESSGSSSRTEGRANSHEESESESTQSPCPPSSESTLEQEIGKERVKPRRSYMTRSSFQKGYVFARKNKRGTVHVIRYRVRK